MANNEQRRKDATRTLECELKRRARVEKLKPLGVVVTTLAILLFIGGGICLLTMTGGADDNEVADESTTPAGPATLATTPTSGEKVPMKRFLPLPETVSCDYSDGGEASKDIDKSATDNVPATGTVTITLKTNQGDIPMELDRAILPRGVNAIEHMAKSNYSNDTVCHRIIGGGLNVLQCDDPTGTGAGGPDLKFVGRWSAKGSGLGQDTPLVYPEGSIATVNPSDPDANDSQFFLNWVDPQLPPQYTVLGSMIDEGTKTAVDIAKNGTEGGGTSDDKLAKEVRIEKTEVKQLTQLTN